MLFQNLADENSIWLFEGEILSFHQYFLFLEKNKSMCFKVIYSFDKWDPGILDQWLCKMIGWFWLWCDLVIMEKWVSYFKKNVLNYYYCIFPCKICHVSIFEGPIWPVMLSFHAIWILFFRNEQNVSTCVWFFCLDCIKLFHIFWVTKTS